MEEVDINIRQKVIEAIEQLITHDFILLKNDVSERAIAHKLAEHLQGKFPEYNVDCEYNRNVKKGANHAKTINFLERERKKIIPSKSIKVNDTEVVSTYPDIIIHRRESNERNKLIIELKKSNNQNGINFDILKLTTFTSNEYRYKYGLLVIIEVGPNFGFPALHWYSGGQEIDVD